MWPWVAVTALALIGGLGVGLVVWLIRGRLRQRRKTRYLVHLSAQLQRQRQALRQQSRDSEPAKRGIQVRARTGSHVPRQRVTVAELVARIEAEGLPVRLRWSQRNEGYGLDEDNWPTGVLPRTVMDEEP